MDFSLPGSSIHGIFQARVLEWGAIAFSVLILDTFIINITYSGWVSVRSQTFYIRVNKATDISKKPFKKENKAL